MGGVGQLGLNNIRRRFPQPVLKLSPRCRLFRAVQVTRHQLSGSRNGSLIITFDLFCSSLGPCDGMHGPNLPYKLRLLVDHPVIQRKPPSPRGPSGLLTGLGPGGKLQLGDALAGIVLLDLRRAWLWLWCSQRGWRGRTQKFGRKHFIQRPHLNGHALLDTSLEASLVLLVLVCSFHCGIFWLAFNHLGLSWDLFSWGSSGIQRLTRHGVHGAPMVRIRTLHFFWDQNSVLHWAR